MKASVDFTEQARHHRGGRRGFRAREITAITPNPVRIVSVGDMKDATSFTQRARRRCSTPTPPQQWRRSRRGYFFAESYEVRINGSALQKDLKWTRDKLALLTLEDDGDYVVTVSGKDCSGNGWLTTHPRGSLWIRLRPLSAWTTMAMASNKLVKWEGFADGIQCDDTVVARVTIQGLFRPDEVKLLVTAKNAAEQDVLTPWRRLYPELRIGGRMLERRTLISGLRL